MPDSEDILEKILTDNPSAQTLCIVLRELLKKGKVRMAIKECNKAIHYYPDHVPLLLLLSEAYLEAGFIGLAEETLEKAGSKVREMARLFKLQAQLYLSQGRETEASSALKVYLALHPDDQEAIEMLDNLTPEKEPALEPEPTAEEPPLVTPTLAEIYYQQGQIQEAIKIYQEVLSREPDNSQLATRLAELRALASAKEVYLPEEVPEPVQQQSKEQEARLKAISVLETWLSKIQELGRAQENA